MVLRGPGAWEPAGPEREGGPEGGSEEVELSPEEVRGRFRWARRQGHPGYVWPEIPVPLWRQALREVERATRGILAGEPAVLPDREDLPLRALGIAAYTSGMGPLLAWWAGRGALETGERVRELLARHLEHGRVRALRFRDHLTGVAAALGEARVRTLVLKSGHTAWAYFPEPGTRPAADLDLAVEPDAWRAAEEALARAGWMRTGGQARPLKSEWLAPGSARLPRSLELTHRDDPYALDLHASLDRNIFGVATVRIPAPRRPAPELGDTVDVLEQPALFALHALHASEGLHALTLVRLVELVLLARRDRASGALQTGELLALLRETGAAPFVHPAVALTERLAPGTLDPRVVEAVSMAAPPRLRRLVASLSPSDAQRPTRRSLAEVFMWCRTPGDYVRRLLHMVGPAPAGASPGALVRVYLARAYRLLRGRVSLGGRAD